jgi:hypothetical protein
MVATVKVYQATAGSDGTPGAETEITSSTRLQTKDQFDPADTTYPIPIPTSGFKYSMWIHVYLKITGGSFTKVNNIRFYSDGAIGWNYGSNGKLNRGMRNAGDQGAPMNTNYEVATGTNGVTGDAIDDPTNGHSYFKTAPNGVSNVALDLVGAPPVIDSTDHTTVSSCKAVVLQVKVDTDATQGEQIDETLTFLYDEI